MPKGELHVTLAGSRLGFSGEALREAAAGLDFAVKPRGVYRLVKRDARRALIVLVETRGLAEFCARLNAPVPPCHVTLFTEAGGCGIALYTAAELEALSTPVDVRVNLPWQLDGDGAILGS